MYMYIVVWVMLDCDLGFVCGCDLVRVSVGIEHIEDIKVGTLLTLSLFRT
jgi:hypothetical protein